MKLISLRPITESPIDYEALEKRIRDFFKSHIYLPLMLELGQKKKTLKNADEDYPNLNDAIRSGRITFYRGTFSGRFNSSTSKELRGLGARFDRKTGTYKIEQSSLPMQMRINIKSSVAVFEKKMAQIDAKLAAILPDELVDKLNVSELFDRTIWRVEDSFQKSVKNITVTPKLTPDQLRKLSDQYATNMQLYVKDFMKKEILELRQTIGTQVFKGNRYEGTIQAIQDSYGVSARKAKFLARQETMLMTTTLKQIRYKDAGITHYKWRCVRGSPQHPVRPMHQALNDRSDKGELFEFSSPPVDDPNGTRHNPGQNFNCFPGSTLVTLDRPINKIFRRVFSGELTLLVCNDDVVLESTPNHPILTNRGWIAAKDIQVGDYLFQRQNESVNSKEVNVKKMVASFEDIFGALGFCSQLSLGHATSDADFHGDTSVDQKVDVISFERELVLDRITSIFQCLRQLIFEPTNALTLCQSLLDSCGVGSFTSPDRVMSFLGELRTLLLRHLTQADVVRLGTSSFLNIALTQPTGNNNAFDFVFSRDCQLTHPSLIILDRILIQRIENVAPSASLDLNATSPEILAQKVRGFTEFSSDLTHAEIASFVKPLRVIDKSSRSFSGHIYNLETPSHWYIAENLCLRNCRCVAIPVVRAKQ